MSRHRISVVLHFSSIWQSIIIIIYENPRTYLPYFFSVYRYQPIFFGFKTLFELYLFSFQNNIGLGAFDIIDITAVLIEFVTHHYNKEKFHILCVNNFLLLLRIGKIISHLSSFVIIVTAFIITIMSCFIVFQKNNIFSLIIMRISEQCANT